MDAIYKKNSYEHNPAYKLSHITGTHTKNIYPTNLHYDTDLTITYFKKCTGSIKIDGKHYNIEQGDVILLNPDELHCFTIKDEPYHERISIYIKESILDNFLISNKLSFNILYNRKSGIGNLITAEQVKKHKLDIILEDILNYTVTEDAADEVIAVCKIIELLSQINKLISPSVHTDFVSTSENPTINEVLKFLNTNFSDKITIQDISEKFYISKYHLCRLFKENVGISLWDYVILRRLIYFNDLVKKNTPIEKACYQAGFHNYSNFFRLYKKHMHMTPLEFKKQK